MGSFARDHPAVVAEGINDDSIFRVHSEDVFTVTKKMSFSELVRLMEERLKSGLVYQLDPIVTLAGELEFTVGELVDQQLRHLFYNSAYINPELYTFDSSIGKITLLMKPEDIFSGGKLVADYVRA
jgi:hypothetical protein